MHRLVVACLSCALIQCQVLAREPNNVTDVQNRIVDVTFPGKGSEVDWQNSLLFYDKSQRELLNKSYDQAIADAQHAIDIYPHMATFYNQLAINHWQRNKPGDLAEGIRIIRKALELAPYSYQYWDNLAKGLADANQTADARDALLHASNCNPPQEKLKEIQSNLSILDNALLKKENSKSRSLNGF